MTAIIDANLEPLGYEQVTGLTAVKKLTVPAGATFALISTETQPVRWRDDATAPTASVGQRLVADVLFMYTGDLSRLRFIEESATAKLNVCYYKSQGGA